MESKTALPDLSVTPATSAPRAAADKYEETTDLIEAAVSREELEEAMPTLFEKGEEYAKKLAAGEKGRKEGPKEEVKAPTLPGQIEKKPSSPVEERIKTRRAAIKGKQKKGTSAAAKATLAMMSAVDNKPPVKPLPVPKEEKKEARKEEQPPEEEKTPQTSFKEEESEGELTETERSDEKLWEDARKSPVKDFPEIAVPDLSEEYREFSVASSHIEGLGADIQALSRQLTLLTTTVKEQNVQVATLKATVDQLQEDKSQFLSHVLDRVRHIERQMGNKPSIATASDQLSGPMIAGPDKEKPSPGASMSLEEKKQRLAALRAQKKW